MIQKPGRNENFYPVFSLNLEKYDMMRKSTGLISGRRGRTTDGIFSRVSIIDTWVKINI